MKDKEASELFDKIGKASGKEQERLVIQYCEKLIELKDSGKIREEEASYYIVAALLPVSSMTPEVAAIFDSAADAEIDREVSYGQPIGEWNQKTADKIKQEEWSV
ncbi:MAG: hypothetical protein P4L61_03215, partial [Candidatus Pacebacteria bacterium]|nr:hypothetical protein [Candidatus Paceibacterota bacterium]